MSDNYNNNGVFRWEDTIVDDGGEFVVLTPGDYDYTIIGFERGYFDGSDKMPACPQAFIKIRINSPQGEVTMEEKLFLAQKSEWKLSEFFASIGRKKKGEPLRMNWNNIIGLTGRCTIGNRVYNGNTYNDVKRWLPAPGYDQPSPRSFTPPTPGRY